VQESETMQVTPDVVEEIATLARLDLDADRRERLAGDLAQILSYVAMLDELDTTSVEPMAHAVELYNVFRDDQVQPSLPREKALQNAPKQDGEFFLVPAVL
jgi:aspartyl-tRNA(Asn)/glutamyl-tRNA(Gln) amidotransferase subunit C